MVDMSTDVSGIVELNESSGEKTYVISGNFSTPDKKNRNGRVYSKSIWESNVARYQNEIINNTNNTLMELEHPPRTQVDPWEAVAKIRKLEMKDGYVYGEAVILNNGDKKTNQIKALIEAGLKIGVSTRGTGKMKGDIVEEYNLITVDVVSNPSNYESSLEGFNESMILESLDIEIDESGKYVCTPAGCTLVSDKKLDESEEKDADDLNESKIKEISYKDLVKAAPEAGDVYDGTEGYTFFYDKKEDLFYHFDSKTKEYNFIHQTGTSSDKNLDKLSKTALDILSESKVEKSDEPSCGCKAKAVVEALEKFANKNIETEQEKADRLLKEKFDALFEKKDIKYTMCPNCNEQNDIKVDPKKNKTNYVCENCKKSYQGSYYENGKIIRESSEEINEGKPLEDSLDTLQKDYTDVYKCIQKIGLIEYIDQISISSKLVNIYLNKKTVLGSDTLKLLGSSKLPLELSTDSKGIVIKAGTK